MAGISENPGFSFAIGLTKNLPWPPLEAVTILTIPEKNGYVATVHANKEAQIEVKVTDGGGITNSLVSPPILRPVPASIKLAFSVGVEGASLAVNGKVVASTKKGFADAPAKILLEADAWAPDEEKQESLLKKAKETQGRRTASEIAKKPGKADWRLRSLEECLNSLAERKLALLEQMAAVKEGRIHHLVGVSTAIRALISRGNRAHPLIQRVAGLLDQPLLVFGHPPDKHSNPTPNLPLPDDADYSFVCMSITSGCYEMDLDDWLEQVGFVFRGVMISNNDLIRLFTDKDGAHYDPYVPPTLDHWERVFASGSPMRSETLLRIGAVIVSLANQLLAAGKS